MKAINVNQPWAELIMQGRKTIERPEWRPRYRDQLAIRATKIVLQATSRRFDLGRPRQFTVGTILGTVALVGVIEFDVESWRVCRDQHLNNAYSPDN